MKLKKYERQRVKLIDIDDNIYTGIAYFCDKEDYEAEEDGLEMRVGKDIWIFYESDIKSIEIIA